MYFLIIFILFSFFKNIKINNKRFYKRRKGGKIGSRVCRVHSSSSSFNLFVPIILLLLRSRFSFSPSPIISRRCPVAGGIPTAEVLTPFQSPETVDPATLAVTQTVVVVTPTVLVVTPTRWCLCYLFVVVTSLWGCIYQPHMRIQEEGSGAAEGGMMRLA